jgi:subtilisin-like proprotein convertase family protein
LAAKKRLHAPRRFWVERLEERNLLSANPWVGEATSTPFDPTLWPQVQSAAGGGGAAAEPFDPAQAFSLHSLPGATKTIYLDFDGHVTVNTGWNTAHELPSIVTPSYDSDGDLINFSEDERLAIYAIWQRVSEDFRPFNVNVTTQDPGVEALRNTTDPDDPEDPDDPVAFDDEWGIRVVIGGNENTWYHPEPLIVSGGVAHIGSFTSAIDDPCFVFAGDYSTSIEFIGETASHEAGHTLGLVHDSQFRFGRDVTDEDGDGNPDEDPPPTVRVFVQYYPGHGYTTNLETSWSPIMGGGGAALTQWSFAEYINATNDEAGTAPRQDDLHIITTQNGFDYRDDDHGSSVLDATTLPTYTDLVDLVPDEDGGYFAIDGIIERNTDLDYFSFEVVGAGEWFTFDISPFAGGPNLDVLASILDSSGRELYRSNPLDGIGAGTQTHGAFSDGGWAQLDELGNIIGYVDTFSLLPGTYFLSVDGTGRPTTFIDPLIHPGPPDVTADTAPQDDVLDAKDFPFDESDWGYSDYGSLGYYSITGTRKTGLLIGVDFDTDAGASPFNWNTATGGAVSTETLTDLQSEAGFTTNYDLTITTTGTALTTVASPAIDAAALPNHAFSLEELSGYLTAADGETLTFTYSELTPDTVYEVYVFGHASSEVRNEVTITGGEWVKPVSGEGVTQTLEFTHTAAANGLAVNDDDSPGGDALSTLALYVISDENGEIKIEVTNVAGFITGIAGVAIAETQLGSLTGQKWNDLNGDGGGSADPGEVGLPGWLIYLDTNNNGVLDMIDLPDTTYTLDAPEVPQVLLDASTVKNELIVAQTGAIVDMNVSIDISHTYNGDVNVWLERIDPVTLEVITVMLIADLGGNSDNIDTTFDDSAAASITTVTPAMAPFNTVSYRPVTPLSAFNGLEASGKWTLHIQDDGPGDTGVLNGWSMELTIAGTTQLLEPHQVTDAEGNYTFLDLKPGLYYVREHVQPQQTLDGWRQTWSPPPVTVTSDGEITGIDFGNWIPIFDTGGLAGQVWNDLDDDGEKDAGEPGLEGWNVYIDANSNGVRDVSTNPINLPATGLPLAITDLDTITTSIDVGNLGSILEIEVTLDITHSFMADVEAFLTSPSGRTVELFSSVGAQFNDFHNITFSDSAARSIDTIGQADLPYTGTWRPEGSLLEFFGDGAEGLWTLTIRDTTFADEGTLNSWSITITVGERFTTTDADGNYSFDELPPGQYLIRQEVQPGWTETYSPPITDNGGGNFSNVNVVPSAVVTADFGNHSLAPALAGDYNRDGFVNTADYLYYRKTLGQSVPFFAGADGDGDGVIDSGDRVVWEQNFGRYLDDHSNGSSAATALTIGTSASGNLEVESDKDWFSFDAVSGETYRFDASLGSLFDSYVRLFDTNGTSELAYDDDGLGGLGSRIDWTAPASGTYYVEVTSFNSLYAGTYTLASSIIGGGGGGGLAAGSLSEAALLAVEEQFALDPVPVEAVDTESEVATAVDTTTVSSIAPRMLSFDDAQNAYATNDAPTQVSVVLSGRTSDAQSRDAAFIAWLNSLSSGVASNAADADESDEFAIAGDADDDADAELQSVDALFDLIGA